MEILETNRFRLEMIQDKHYQYLNSYALKEELWVYSTVKIKTEDDFKEYFNQALAWSNQTSQQAFVVCDLEKDEYIGMTRLYAFDSKNKSAKLGFTWYALESQGTGVNTHVKYLVLKHAFEKLNLERIELNADLRNERSIAAMKKMGATQEGILRKNVYLPDGFKRDTVIFSVLKEDWEGGLKFQLEDKIKL